MKDQTTVHMLLQLVEPRNYAKLCKDTIVVVCNVQGAAEEGDSLFELGFSMNSEDLKNYGTQPARHTAFAGTNSEPSGESLLTAE